MLATYINPMMKTVGHIERGKQKVTNEAEMRQRLREKYPIFYLVIFLTIRLPLKSASGVQFTGWPTRQSSRRGRMTSHVKQ